MRVEGTMTDKGHYARKAAWLALAVLLFIPHILCFAAAKADEWIYRTGEQLFKWSHPCLFAKRWKDDSDV